MTAPKRKAEAEARVPVDILIIEKQLQQPCFKVIVKDQGKRRSTYLGISDLAGCTGGKRALERFREKAPAHQDQHTAEHEKLREAHGRLEEAHGRLAAECKDVQAELASCKEENHKYQAENKQLQCRYGKLQNSYNQRAVEYNTLQADVDRYQDEQGRCATERDGLRMENKRLEGRCSKLLDDCARKTAEHEALQGVLARCQDELDKQMEEQLRPAAPREGGGSPLPVAAAPVLGPGAPSSGEDEPVHHSEEGEMGSPLLSCILASWVADDEEG